jgi:hypothetical protein
VFGDSAFTEISRRHLHLLAPDRRPAWLARREGRLHAPAVGNVKGRRVPVMRSP